jgi:hypothetical protein
MTTLECVLGQFELSSEVMNSWMVLCITCEL